MYTCLFQQIYRPTFSFKLFNTWIYYNLFNHMFSDEKGWLRYFDFIKNNIMNIYGYILVTCLVFLRIKT